MGIFGRLKGRRPAKKVNIDRERLPRHIGIIMDGNGRWAKARKLPRSLGHSAGSETFRRVATYCKDIGIEYLTVYAFSTENWKRPPAEVEGIMSLLEKYLVEALAKMRENRVRLKFFGELSALPPVILKLIKEAEAVSAQYEGVQVNICLNYGGRDEILRAARDFALDCLKGQKSPGELDGELFSGYLYSAGIPDPDLIIRPSGELRLSNFLSWQSAYSELYFTDTLWPDFKPSHIDEAIAEYQRRDRRFGGLG